MSLIEVVLHWDIGDRLWFKTPSGPMQAIAEAPGRNRVKQRFLVFVLEVDQHVELPGQLVYMMQKSAYLEASTEPS